MAAIHGPNFASIFKFAFVIWVAMRVHSLFIIQVPYSGTSALGRNIHILFFNPDTSAL